MKRNLWTAVGACLALAGGAVAGEAPSACSNAYLWLDAAASNTLTVSDGIVSAWRSVNAGGVAAATYSISDSGNSPTGPSSLTTNGLTLVSFGSTTANKDLSFTKATNIRAVFMVAKVEQGANAFFLGDSSAYDFHRGASGQYWHSNHAAAGIKNGQTYRNGTLVSSPTSTVMPADFGLTEVHSTADLTASQLCYDRDGGDPRRGGKDIAELLVFTNEVASADRVAIRGYLLSKWRLVYDTDEGVHRNDTDLSAGVSLGTAFTQGKGSYGFKNVKLTGNVQGSGDYAIVVEAGDRVEIAGDGDSLNGRNKFAWDIRGGEVVWPATASTWYENASFRQSGGTFTAQNTGTGTSGTGNGVLLGFNGSPAMTFDITGGLFAIPNSSLNFYNPCTFNISSNGTVKVKGAYKSNNKGTVNIEKGGTFALGSLGMTADAAAVNLNGGTFSAYETTTLRAPVDVAAASSIYVPTGVTLTVAGAITGAGPVTFAGGGTVVFTSEDPTCAWSVADDGTTVETITRTATVVRAHPRLTRGLDRESLIGVKFSGGTGGTLTNLVVRFDCTNCTPAQITDVRLWKQPHDPVPFAFYEAQAEDEGLGTREEGLENGLEVRFNPSVTISPSTASQEESDYLWVTATIDKNIATNAEIWASVEGTSLEVAGKPYALANQVAAAPHRPFPYYYQIGAYVRQDRLVDNGKTTSDVFSNHPELRYPNLTDVIVIYHLTIGSTSSGYAFTAWDTGGYNDTASTAHIVADRNRYHPACMVRGSITNKTFADAGASAATREQFATYVVNFCREQHLDGIDLDYEWVNDNTNHAEWQKIGKMLRALSEHFFDAGLVLSLSTRLHDSTYSGMPYSTADYGTFHTADFITSQTYGGGNINAGHTIQVSGLSVCTKRGVPKRRVVLGQAMFSSQNQYGWDGAVGPIEAYVTDTLRRYDIDTTNPQSSSYAVFEGPSSYRGQCDWVRSEDIGGVMSWGYYCDVNWTGWASLGRHQAMSVWPLPPVDEASSPRQIGEATSSSLQNENVYLLGSESDWRWLFTHPAVSAQLTSDITFTHDPLAIANFTGTIDGAGHTLTIPADVWVTSGDKAGLVKVLSGTVKNLNIKLAGRVYTLAGRWNDPNQAASTVRVTNYTSGENHTGVLAGEIASGGRIENVSVEIADGAEVKGVRYVGGLVGYVNDGATLASNRVTVAGIVHEEVRNTFDTLFTPTTPRVGAVYGKLAGSSATLIDNDYKLEATARLQDVNYIPPATWGSDVPVASLLESEPIATPVATYTLNIGAGDWIAEVDFNLTNFAARLTTEAYPQLVAASCGADGTISLSANRGNGCELFLTGSGTASYAYPVSHAVIRGNGDVGSNVALNPINGKVTLRLENHGGELRIVQNGTAILVTDKNIANGGSVNRLVFGTGLAQLGGGVVEAVRFAALSPARLSGNTLVWSDEFDAGALDTVRWSRVPDDSSSYHINWRQYTSERADLVAVTNGSLVLKGIKNDGADPDDTRKFLCGQVWGKDKLSFSRGTFEIRAKFDNQDGAWPALWMMPDCGNWPYGGEIDIVERLNADALVYQSVHHGPAPDTYQTKTGAIDNGTWNVYRLEWDNDAIRWYVNGTLTATYANDGTGETNWPFTTPFYFILSQQLEGSWVGTVDDTSTLPVNMYVDYVRVYQDPNVTGTAMCVDGEPSDPRRYASLHLDASDAASVGTDASGVVTNWGAAYAYTLAKNSPTGPTLVENALNGLPVMSFGSTTDNRDLAFDRETGVRTVFMVGKFEQGANAFVLGDATAYDFHRGTGGEYWSGTYASSSIREGATWWNGEAVADPTGAAMPSGWGLLELSTTAGVTASQLCYDRGGTDPRRGGKDIAELYLFECPLEDCDRTLVSRSLMAKWGLDNTKFHEISESATVISNETAGLLSVYNNRVAGATVTLAGDIAYERFELLDYKATAIRVADGTTIHLLAADDYDFELPIAGTGTLTLDAPGRTIGVTDAADFWGEIVGTPGTTVVRPTHYRARLGTTLADELTWLPIGDSITEGEQDMGHPDSGDAGTRGGYRYQLWKALEDAGQATRSVGYRTGHGGGSGTGANCVEPDDCRWAWHAAQYGGVIMHDNGGTHGAAGMNVESTLEVAGYPDVITVLIGVNDLSFTNGNADPVSWVYSTMVNMVKKIAALRPKSRILVSTLLPAGGSRGYIDTYNALLRAAADGGSAPFDLPNVRLADMHREAFGGTYDAANYKDDGLHPNETGSVLLGRAFAAEIENLVLDTATNAAEMVAVDNAAEGQVRVRFSKALGSVTSARLSLTGTTVRGAEENLRLETPRISDSDARVLVFALPEDRAALVGGTYTATLDGVVGTDGNGVALPAALALEDPRFVEILGSGAAENVAAPYLAGFTRIGTLAIGTNDNFGAEGPGEQWRASCGLPEYVKRVGYYMELKRPGKPAQFVWVSMNARNGFARLGSRIGIPTASTGNVKALVTDLQVYGNRGNFENTTNGTGIVEFTPWNWNATDEAGYPSDFNAGAWGWNDTLATGYLKGGMQVAEVLRTSDFDNYTKVGAKMLFAYNNFNRAARADVAIGSFSTHRDNAGAACAVVNDWTDFSAITGYAAFFPDAYEVRKLEIWAVPDPDYVPPDWTRFTTSTASSPAWTSPDDAVWTSDGSVTVRGNPVGFSVGSTAATLTINLVASLPAGTGGALAGWKEGDNTVQLVYDAAADRFDVTYNGTSSHAATVKYAPADVTALHVYTIAITAAGTGVRVYQDGDLVASAPGVYWTSGGTTLNTTYTLGSAADGTQALPGLLVQAADYDFTAAANSQDRVFARYAGMPSGLTAAQALGVIAEAMDADGAIVIPPIVVNGTEFTGGDAVSLYAQFGASLAHSTNLTFGLDAPVLADGQVGLALAGDDPVNAALKLQNASEPAGPWTTAAEIAAGAENRNFLFATDDGKSFYRLVTAGGVTTPVTEGMPVSLTSAQKVNMGNLAITESDIAAGTLTVQLAGAGVQGGLRAALVVNGTALVAHSTAEGTLTFNLSTISSQLPTFNLQPLTSSLCLYTSGGLANGDLYVSSPAVSGLTYSPAVLTAMVADGLKADGFTTIGGYGQYRIPALVSDGKGEVIACYDVRYGGGDLGTGDGIDIGESYSADSGLSFDAPRLAVDVPNTRDENQVSHGYARTNDLGDVCLLYDHASETYWMMGMTGKGLSGGDYSMNDVVLYRRGKGRGTAWEFVRSVKDEIAAQDGVANGSGGYGYGFLEGPGHGIVTSKGHLVFPMQYFVDSSFTASSAGALYSTDHGATWHATHRTTTSNGPQENSVMELDDGSWYMSCKAGYRSNNYAQTGRFQFFRTTDFVEWTYVDERFPVPCQQGSCLRLGRNGAGVGQYVYCHTLDPESGVRSKLALVFGSDTTASADATAAAKGVAWDDDSTLMLYLDNTGFKGYNSLAMLDDHTLGVLYEAQGHIYFIRIDVSERLR